MVDDPLAALGAFTDRIDRHLEPRDGVALENLRQIILDFAVRGALIHQEANDDPAAVLSCQIAAEREERPTSREAGSDEFLVFVPLTTTLTTTLTTGR